MRPAPAGYTPRHTPTMASEEFRAPRSGTWSRRRVLRAGGGLAGSATLGSLAGCLGGSSRSRRLAYPLDRSDPSVMVAHEAERRAYAHYGLKAIDHFVEVPDLGLQLRVAEVGDGPPVLLIAGGIGEGLKWLPLLPELHGFTAYVMDRPGAGLSDGIDYRARPIPEIAAATTGAVFDHFGLDGAPIVGSSMGAHWALRFALAAPDRVGPIGLLGTPALYPGTSAPFPQRLSTLPVLGPKLVESVLQPDGPDDTRKGWEVLGHPPETAAGLPEPLAEAHYRMDNLPSFERSWVTLSQEIVRLRGAVPSVALTHEHLAAIRLPVQLLWGRSDPFGSVETGRAGAASFWDASFDVVGVGHLPWLDAPAACGEKLRRHLAGPG